jgi:CBS domain-containing protein
VLYAARHGGTGCASDTRFRLRLRACGRGYKKKLKLVGVVTERDVCCGVAADDRRASEVRVEEIMPPASACCGADEPVNDNCYL